MLTCYFIYYTIKIDMLKYIAFLFLLIHFYIKQINDEFYGFIFIFIWILFMFNEFGKFQERNKKLLEISLISWLLISIVLKELDSYYIKSVFRPYIVLLPFLITYIIFFVKKYLSKDRA